MPRHEDITEWIRAEAERASFFETQIAATIAEQKRVVKEVASQQEFVKRLQLQQDERLREALRYEQILKKEIEQRVSMERDARRWRDDMDLLWKTLPQRGWYPTGQEPASALHIIAGHMRKREYGKVDEAMMRCVVSIQIHDDDFDKWLEEHGVRLCCRKRVKVFLRYLRNEDHEAATFIGVPLLDELAQSLYGGRTFTTKRAKQPRPQVACGTPDAHEMERFFSGFVNEFGMLHLEVDPSKLKDECYWNRHAIVHGMMRRSMNPMDSAKCLSAILFLIFACDDTTGQRNQGDQRGSPS